MHWIMILMIVSDTGQIAVTTAEFDTKQACVAAVANLYDYYHTYGATASATCESKGGN